RARRWRSRSADFSAKLTRTHRPGDYYGGMLQRHAFLFCALCVPALLSADVFAIRAGRLIDPETGSSQANQIVLVDGGKFTAVGGNVTIPQGAEVIDLSRYSVLPGLVDAHNHLALTYKRDPENNVYYLTSVLDSTAIRAIQAVSN